MLLQLENISLGFPNQPLLLSNANLQIENPGIIPLFGKNGVGKSVFLRALAGITHPLQGKISIHNKTLIQLDPQEKASMAAYMSATPPTSTNLSVEEIILTGRQRFISGIKSPSTHDYNAIETALENTGISSIKKYPFSELSDGTKQKVMPARCLAQDSRIILLDEPLAFLDYPTRIEFLKLLKIISQKNNKLIIYSSHDLSISIDQASAVLAINNQTLHFFTEPSQFSKDWLFPVSAHTM